MKLNPDCIRDILLEVESSTDYENSLYYSCDKIPRSLSSYQHQEIIYHIHQCQKNELIECSIYDDGCSVDLIDLTPKGHEFLATIRSHSIWSSTKSIAGKIGCFSLDTLSKIASSVLSQLIITQFSNH